MLANEPGETWRAQNRQGYSCHVAKLWGHALPGLGLQSIAIVKLWLYFGSTVAQPSQSAQTLKQILLHTPFAPADETLANRSTCL